MRGVLIGGDRAGLPTGLFTRTAGLLLVVAALTMLFSDVATAGEPSSAPLVFAGSGTNLAITRLLVEAFGQRHPQVNIQIPKRIGSTGAIRAVAERAVTVGLISRPLRGGESGLGLIVLPYAKTAVVIGVHPTFPEDGITFEELLQIYRGTKSRWKNGREIVVLTREPGDSSLEVLGRAIPGFKAAYAESQQAKRWTTLLTDQEMHRVLAETPYAIGLSDLGSMVVEKLAIKALNVNGIPPTPENARSGKYPLIKTLSFAFFEGTLPAGAKSLLEFVRSRQGEKIIREKGYLPAR
jgi:phosphate transport system substrate-binding protein